MGLSFIAEFGEITLNDVAAKHVIHCRKWRVLQNSWGPCSIRSLMQARLRQMSFPVPHDCKLLMNHLHGICASHSNPPAVHNCSVRSLLLLERSVLHRGTEKSVLSTASFSGLRRPQRNSVLFFSRISPHVLQNMGLQFDHQSVTNG